MRKAAVMIGFGAFFLTMALLMRFYAYERLAVIPSDQNVQQVSTDDHASYFDANRLKAAQGPITTRTTVVADKAASKQATKELGKDVIVINEWQSTNSPAYAAANKPPIEAITERVAVDKSSGKAVNWAGNQMDGKPTDIEGQTIKLPFGVDKSTTYDYWDMTLQKAFPLHYAGTETIMGMKTYRFTQSIPLTKFRTQEIPGEVFGLPKGGKVADRSYGNDRTIWADPTTGVIMKLQENQHQTLTVPNAAPVNAMSTTSTFNEDTIRSNVDDYKSKANQLKILHTWAPLFLGLLGLAAIALGLLVSAAATRNRREGRHAGTTDHKQEPVYTDSAEMFGHDRPRGAHLPEHDEIQD